MGEGSPPRLDLRFLRNALRLARPYWRAEERRTAWARLALLLALLVAYTQFAVLFNEQSGEFTSALAARDGPRFWRSILAYFGLLVIGVPIDAFYYFVRDGLALHWRRWMTGRLLGRYLSRRAYYHLAAHPVIDNPDQRLADDVNAFTQQSLTFVLVFATAALQLAAFGRVLWTISSGLVWFLFVYAAVMTGVTVGLFGERLVTLYARQRQREADFRFGLVRLRENAEAVAFYRGEAAEGQRLETMFGRLFDNARRIIRWSLGLNCFYYTNSYLALVLPAIIVAPRVLSGELEVGRIVQATGAFSAILAALTLLVDNLESLSRFAASVARLEAFDRGLAHVARPPAGRRIRTETGAGLALEHFTLDTPEGGRRILTDLTLALPPGGSLLITGASGSGKSSLLRAIAGLWETGSGLVQRPAAEEMLFLPQQPYLPLGNLRAQLDYPGRRPPASDAELTAALEAVNLGGFARRCGGLDGEAGVVEKTASIGERQRLAFARLLLARPRFALLDEATSALDPENEAALYARLRASGTAYVSVSHHQALERSHDRILEIEGEGRWRLRRP